MPALQFLARSMSAREFVGAFSRISFRKLIVELYGWDQDGLLGRVRGRKMLILGDKSVFSCLRWLNQERLGKRWEQSCHRAHAAQWARVVWYRRALLPDLIDGESAQSEPLVVRPNDVHASGVTIRCSALWVGSPIQYWFGHASPNRPN